MVVDDEVRDRLLLKEILEGEGYSVAECSDGLEAIDQVQKVKPDAILLDVMLPGLDGVQVCQHLNQDPTTKAIPVLLVTSHKSREARLGGISAGARDFISKPVDIPDLKVRVRNAIQIKRLFDESEGRYRKILELEELRDGLLNMVIHDLRSPLTLIQGNLGLLELMLGTNLDSEGQETLMACSRAATKMRQMVNSLLDLNRLESGALSPDCRRVDVSETVLAARATLGQAASRRVRIDGSEGKGEAFAVCDPDLIERVIVNLLWNALERAEGGETVGVRVFNTGSVVRVEVEDRGRKIPPSLRETLFERHVQAVGERTSMDGSGGLALAFSKVVVEAQRGRISVEDGPNGGTVFWFEVPSDPFSG
jgi:signal transduction histidine kinase